MISINNTIQSTQSNDRNSVALSLLVFMGALSIFAATLEYIIPKPMPFLRLGLANIPILYAVRLWRFREVMIITLLKVLGQGLINGTLLSYIFIFSLCGSFMSSLIMYGLAYLLQERISLIGLSLAGAWASNYIQILLATVFIFGSHLWLLAPWLLLFGSVSGIMVGWFATFFLKHAQFSRILYAHIV